MDKLVKLLNEYEREKQGLPKDFEDYTMWNIEGNEIVQSSCDTDSREYFKYYIISKDYQFIKWLVDNDKIDRDNQALQYAKEDLSKFFTEWKDKNGMSDDYAMLLMLLSISDTPIDFLCEIIKK